MTPPSQDLIDLYAEHLRILSRSSRTIGDRRDILARIDAALPYGLAGASAEELQTWIYRDGWSLQTRATYYGAVRSFFLFAAGRHLDYDPTADLPRPRPSRGKPRPVSNEQLARILYDGGEPYRTWALIAAYEGARCIEISRLERDDVTETVTYLHGKGGKERVVPTHPDVWTVVRRLPGGPVALTTDGGRATAQYVSIRAALHFRRQLDMPGVNLHRCRHWYGTHVQRAGKDLRVTQEALGHASPTTTAIYTQVADEDLRAAVHALPRLVTGAGSAATDDAAGDGPAADPRRGTPA